VWLRSMLVAPGSDGTRSTRGGQSFLLCSPPDDGIGFTTGRSLFLWTPDDASVIAKLRFFEAVAEMKKVNFSCENNHYWVRVCEYDEAERRIRSSAPESRLCPLCGAQGRIESVGENESDRSPK
jgi:hypothetical protein